ncbi:MAG: hypothetical protein N2110_07560 [Flavobacteriales bacterium]|nr:hypothetical protein [Flavobacteriales bacterium]
MSIVINVVTNSLALCTALAGMQDLTLSSFYFIDIKREVPVVMLFINLIEFASICW